MTDPLSSVAGRGILIHFLAGKCASRPGLRWVVMEPTVGPDAYGEAFAAVYDDWYGEVTDAEATADFVSLRAGDGLVIELGVGTGRLAAPLLRRGLTVIGIDASASMLALCAAKASSPSLHLVRADMAHLPLLPRADVALIAFNTLFNLTTKEGQQQVFHELRRCLRTNGVVIVEALDLGSLGDAPALSIGVRERRDTGLTVIGTSIDPSRQRLAGRHIDIDDEGIAVRPWDLRLASATEIDDYATSAGFKLVERYREWDGTPHGPDDDRHISVYGPS